MGVNEKILSLIQTRGPSLPAHLSKDLNDSILLTSARLSELLSAKQIAISHLKVGGSPLYFLKGQEEQLQKYSDNLPGKEKEAYDLLQTQKVLADSDQEPAIRVALRSLKDFAVPLEVEYNSEKRLFWRWYLVHTDEVKTLIQNLLTGNSAQNSAQEEQPVQQLQKEVEAIPAASTEVVQAEAEVQPPQPITQEVPKVESEPIQETPVPEPVVEQRIESEQEQTRLEPVKEKTIKKTKTKTAPKKGKSLIDSVHSYFSTNDISVLEEIEVKKNSEMNYIVSFDSAIGSVSFFCKAKQKQKINEADLSAAILQAQSKGLPLLFISSGTPTKKTEEQLSNEFKNIVFKTI